MSRGGFGGRGRGGGFRGRGGFGGRGRGGGGRGGFNRYDAGPPETVTELGLFTHTCEDDIVCKVSIKDVPFFNAPIFFENKQQIGQIDEIFGPVHDYYVSVKLAEDVKANSFAKDQKIFIDPNKLLPLQRFLPKAPGSTPGGRGRGRGGRGGRGGGGRGGSFGRGRGGGFDRGRGGRGGFGRGGGGGYDRGGRGGFDRGGRGGGGYDRGGRGGFGRGGGGGYDRGGRGGFDRGGFKRSFDGGSNNSFQQNKKTKFE